MNFLNPTFFILIGLLIIVYLLYNEIINLKKNFELINTKLNNHNKLLDNINTNNKFVKEFIPNSIPIIQIPSLTSYNNNNNLPIIYENSHESSSSDNNIITYETKNNDESLLPNSSCNLESSDEEECENNSEQQPMAIYSNDNNENDTDISINNSSDNNNNNVSYINIDLNSEDITQIIDNENSDNENSNDENINNENINNENIDEKNINDKNINDKNINDENILKKNTTITILLKNKLAELQYMAENLNINITKDINGRTKKRTKLELANDIIKKKISN